MIYTMGLGEKIKELRAERNWTQSELAKRSGVDRGYLASIETDKVENPAVHVFLKLARAFHIRPEELYMSAGYIDDSRPFRTTRETSEDILERLMISIPVDVPVYEDFPFHAGDAVDPIDYIPVAKKRAKGRNLEGYIVHGRCLEPDIREGNIIIVDRDGQIDSGDIVACLLDNKLYLGRLRKITDEFFLENNDGLISLHEVKLAAPVIEVRRRLK